MRLVREIRTAARGKVKLRGMEDWTSEELNTVLGAMREERWEELYKQVGPFPERYIGPSIEIEELKCEFLL